MSTQEALLMMHGYWEKERCEKHTTHLSSKQDVRSRLSPKGTGGQACGLRYVVCHGSSPVQATRHCPWICSGDGVHPIANHRPRLNTMCAAIPDARHRDVHASRKLPEGDVIPRHEPAQLRAAQTHGRMDNLPPRRFPHRPARGLHPRGPLRAPCTRPARPIQAAHCRATPGCGSLPLRAGAAAIAASEGAEACGWVAARKCRVYFLYITNGVSLLETELSD